MAAKPEPGPVRAMDVHVIMGLARGPFRGHGGPSARLEPGWMARNVDSAAGERPGTPDGTLALTGALY
jgi:hypothetical protein